MHGRTLIAICLIIAEIDSVTSQACGGDLRASQGMVFSPSYRTQRRYSHDLFCVWTFHFGENDQITMMFREMKLENGGTCLKDYVKLSFGDKDDQKVCGFTVPRTTFGGVGPANITFESDSQTSYRGFYIQYVVRDTACKSDPCQNGGTCENQASGTTYTCICVENYTGENCEIEIEIEEPPEPAESCDSEPCQNGGTCNELEDGYQCQCVVGWEGTNCEQNIDECASDPCQNGGTCQDLINAYECQCKEGWTGTNCEEDIDECISNPCYNGGTCENLENGYKCQCSSGWTGLNCDEDIDECTSNPCQNGGTCDNLLNKYKCRCVRGWTGANCEEDVDDCDPNPCKNGGECTDKFNDFKCTCVPPWTGTTCERKKEPEEEKATEKPTEAAEEETDSDDPCASEPCLHEGECIDMGDGSVFCICQDGFSGDFCEEGSNVCIPNPCQNEGTCVPWGESFTCTCAAGWDGDDCTKDIDECLSNPCTDDLVCVDKVNSYICREECDPGFTGDECDVEIDECESEPCLNGATCEDEIGAFTCKCLSTWGGVLCDVNDPCAELPCKNSGTCHERNSSLTNGTGYICACQLGWMGKTCEEVVENGCPNPDGTSDGLVPYGVSLEFYCGTGFSLNGPNVITCEDTGEFTHVIPECIAANGSRSTGASISVKTLKSPMVMSMLIATGLIIFAIAGFFIYLFVCAPWNKPVTSPTC